MAKKKKNILFLDDSPARHEHVDKLVGKTHNVTHAWTVNEAIYQMSNGLFDEVYLDHDLNDFYDLTGKDSVIGENGVLFEQTGHDVAVFMAKTELLDKENLVVIVHSLNPYGAQRIFWTLKEAGFNVKQELFNGGKEVFVDFNVEL